jgi:putative flippase GtrA
MNSLLRFGITGSLATITHAAVLSGLVELLAVPAVVASLPAFGAALLLSYGLNYHWTFRALGEHRVIFPRFTLVAVSGLLLNVLITFLVVNVFGFWYGYALAAVIFSVPLLTYLLSNYWVFRSEA